ncbi:MAG: hypothetical protein JSS83_22140 [Cyanobacteria bacterium SZAS LIN-3]|nr:hypothetical protein [Cyanobacteria bacterium SZAS LIN-3]MBS2005736.1 hypothetical protein [Cyanobacteria bacterium SZAS TMP-1]
MDSSFNLLPERTLDSQPRWRMSEFVRPLPVALNLLPQSDRSALIADATDQTLPPTRTPLDEAREHLKTLADTMVASKMMKGKDRDRLNSDMAAFESRATQAGLTADEIKGTYENTSRLMEYTGQGPIDQANRVKIAEQALHHAANPGQIDQGRHDTCNVSTVEVRNFSCNPAAAIKLIADVATTGSFVASDGTAISIDARSLKTDSESSRNPTADGERSYASQIFQITAANVFWQRRLTDPAGNVATKGSLRFIQDPSKRSSFSGDTGERLMDYASNPPKELAENPALSASALKEIANQISGKSDNGFVIENKIHGGANTVHVGSEIDLKDALLAIKQAGNFPAIIRVHTGNQPFLGDQGGGLSRSKGVWHVVSVTAYDEQTGRVWIDNQWGRSSDHKMKVSDLYDATLEPKGNSWLMMHESTMPSLHVPGPRARASTLLPDDAMWLH